MYITKQVIETCTHLAKRMAEEGREHDYFNTIENPTFVLCDSVDHIKPIQKNHISIDRVAYYRFEVKKNGYYVFTFEIDSEGNLV